MEYLILRSLLLFLILSYNCYGTLPENQSDIFNKLPEDSVVVITLSLENRVEILFGTIEKDMLGDNYLKCFDFEEDCWRLIYSYEKEIVEYYVVGELI